jgi:solute carrier family 25 (mitochondrial carnitine/acylcarnitine transporter), member 20/29
MPSDGSVLSSSAAARTRAPAAPAPRRLAQEALGGLSAGIVGTVLGYPLDTSYVGLAIQGSIEKSSEAVKTTTTTTTSLTHTSSLRSPPFSSRLPLLPSSVKARQQVLGASGIVSTARHIVTHEGPASFYRGLVPPLLSLSILNTLNFTLYSHFQKQFNELLHAGQGGPGPLQPPPPPTCSRYGAAELLRGFRWEDAAAGAAVGPFAGIVSTIENLVKTQLQLDNVRAAPRYKGSRDCVQKLLQKGWLRGIRTLYTGHAVNTLREMAFLATYFGVYEGLRECLFHGHHRGFGSDSDSPEHLKGSNHPWTIPLAGGMAGAVAWTVSFPLDCVRAGVQGQDLSSPPHKKRSAWAMFRTLLVERGIRGLYSGVTPSIVRAFLVSGSRFTAYEAALWFLRGGRDTVP